MRKLALLFLPFMFISAAYGQSTELSLHLNSGLFSFGGQSAVENTAINERSRRIGGGAYTNNPFGSNNALSYGLSGQIQRVTKGNFLFGLQSGFEALRSKVNITRVYLSNMDGQPTPASGHTIFKHNFINVYPYLGYRFNILSLDIDLTVGPEYGFSLSKKEIGKAMMDNGNTIETNFERSGPENDFRLRSSITVHYKKWGFSTGYSFGLQNYMEGYVGGINEAFARFIRFGISYHLF